MRRKSPRKRRSVSKKATRPLTHTKNTRMRQGGGGSGDKNDPDSEKILILCHNRRHFLGICDTAGIEFTLSSLSKVETLDEDVSDDDTQTWNIDIMRPIEPRFRSVLESRFDIITTMCCPFVVFMDETKMEPVQQTWNNIEHILKPRGIFILDVWPTIIQDLVAKNLKVRKAFNKDELTQIQSDAFLNEAHTSKPNLGKVPYYLEVYNKAIAQYIATVEGCMAGKLRGTIVQSLSAKKNDSALAKAVLDRLSAFELKHGPMGLKWAHLDQEGKAFLREDDDRGRRRRLRYKAVFVKM